MRATPTVIVKVTLIMIAFLLSYILYTVFLVLSID